MSLLTAGAALFSAPTPAQAADKKPNILIIWGDDIGIWNISAYNMGMMGYKTPNIDSIAKNGAVFTDWYGQQSCTAGRSSFITGQVGLRTGNLKVGLPGAKEGLQARDVTIAQLLKARGYVTAQFGKNHLGDADETLPTTHGFDEFFGPLYHLNASQEPEHPDYFKDPALVKKYAPRGVIHSWANPDGTQKIEDTGPLTIKRMETVDEEFTPTPIRLHERGEGRRTNPSSSGGTPPACTSGLTSRRKATAKPASGSIPMAWWSMMAMVGQLLAKLKELGLDDNTIVMYSTDNGAEKAFWPDGGASPFRGEKVTQLEGGFRVPCMITWPGVIKPGTVLNDIFAHEDMLPTLLAAAGDPDVKIQAAHRHEGRRQDLQGPPRRLRPHRRAGRQDAQPAQGVLLLQRPGRPGRSPLQPIQDHLQGTARPWR